MGNPAESSIRSEAKIGHLRQGVTFKTRKPSYWEYAAVI